MEGSGFKFEIGAIVLCKSSVETALLTSKMGEISFPFVFVVTTRHLDECPGGVQRNYGISRDGIVAKVHEIELMSVLDFDVEPLKELHRAIRKERRAQPGGI